MLKSIFKYSTFPPKGEDRCHSALMWFLDVLLPLFVSTNRKADQLWVEKSYCVVSLSKEASWKKEMNGTYDSLLLDSSV